MVHILTTMLYGLNSQFLIGFSMQLLSEKFTYQNSVSTLHFFPLCDTFSQEYSEFNVNLTLCSNLTGLAPVHTFP